jgi:hypothetical protein
MSISATRVSLLAAIPDGILTSLRGGDDAKIRFS